MFLHSPPAHAHSRHTRRALFGLLFAVLLLTTACGEKSITTVSSEADAIEILDVLGESDIAAEKREGGEGETKQWSVVVDEGLFGDGSAALAVQVLRDHGLPRPDEPIMDAGGLIPSEALEMQREQQRIRAGIERQLRALPGVTRAIVTVVMGQDSMFRFEPYPATASVLILHKDAEPKFTQAQVQNMVAKGVPNLQPDAVSVTLSQQAPRPLPRREFSVRRRNNILLAAGIGLVTVLGFLLIVLALQTRRQRAELTALRETYEWPLEDGNAEDADDASGEDPKQLEETATESGANGRQRSDIAGQLKPGDV